MLLSKGMLDIIIMEVVEPWTTIHITKIAITRQDSLTNRTIGKPQQTTTFLKE